MWHRPVGSNAFGCSSRYWFFAVYTAAVTRIAFQWAWHPQILPLSPRRSGPHGFLGPLKSPTQTASRSFQSFCRAHERNQQTDRHTDGPRYFVCSNRTHLASAAMWPEINSDLVALHGTAAEKSFWWTALPHYARAFTRKLPSQTRSPPLPLYS